MFVLLKKFSSSSEKVSFCFVISFSVYASVNRLYVVMITSILFLGRANRFIIVKMQIMEGVKEITKKGAKFMDGQEKEFDSIIFATGYKSNVPTWLQVSLTSIIPTHLKIN